MRATGGLFIFSILILVRSSTSDVQGGLCSIDIPALQKPEETLTEELHGVQSKRTETCDVQFKRTETCDLQPQRREPDNGQIQQMAYVEQNAETKLMSNRTNFEELPIREPVVVSNAPHRFLYPDMVQKSGNVITSTGESIIIACPNGKLFFDKEESDDHFKSATCISDADFTISDKSINFYSIRCKSSHRLDIVRKTNQNCEGGTDEIEIGFDIGDNSFIRQIRVCFDQNEFAVRYSNFILTKSIVLQNLRPKYQGNFHNTPNMYGGSSVEKVYKKINTTIRKLDPNAELFNFTKGHLAARADFVFDSQQLATFNYVNAAPQWDKLNNGNWKKIEEGVRNYVKATELGLEVYTGTYGVISTENNKYIYLLDDNKFPIPELFWKVLYRPDLKFGVVFISVNNPYKQDVDNICNDISADVEWMQDWDRTNTNIGRSYACNISDFRRVVTFLPELEDRGLLTDNNIFRELWNRFRKILEDFIDGVSSL